MMRSMYSGVAGLKTHQTKMDVIGNNIANVNTVAYKSQSVTFSELMYQTTQAASGANAVTGTAGINARQIGLGVKTGAINTAISSQGASQTTNNPFDIRITGSAFFIVSNGQNNFFTRDGSFYVDGVGNLAMTSNGYNVMGWQVDPETQDIKMDTVSALRIMSPENMTYPPEATTLATVSGILDKNDSNVLSTSGKTMNLLFYDNLGYSYTAKLNVKATDLEGEYTVTIDSVVDQNNTPVDIGDLRLSGEELGAGVTKSVALTLSDAWEINTDGEIVNKTDPSKIAYAKTGDIDWDLLAQAYNYDNVDELKTMKFTVSDDSTTPPTNTDIEIQAMLDNIRTKATIGSTTYDKLYDAASLTANKMTALGAVKLKYNNTTGAFESIDGSDSINLALSGVNPAGRFEDIKISFADTTMYNNSGTSTIAAASGDINKIGCGRKLGQMSGVSIQDDGRIYASYDNGMSKLLGQIAVAEFANASGLAKEGDNLYKATQNSGDFDGIGTEVKSGGGYMTTGVLEMSNVDLSAEFTEMITTQRGFQANSRIITVSDTLLEELVNLKR